MGFPCILSMLEVVHELIKFVQSCNAFVCDFVGDVKMCDANVYPLYFDPKEVRRCIIQEVF